MSDISDPTPRSMRDAFHKILVNPAIEKKDLILAETITRRSNFNTFYRDLLGFETDLAQITELILLFCESEGSFAELGAFAVTNEIANRLLVIVRDKYWNENSFIRRGPLQLLNVAYDRSVFVIDDLDVGIINDSPSALSINVLRDRLQEPLIARLAKTREPKTFDSSRDGHLIKLVVGFIQDYGALTVIEMQIILKQHSINIADGKLNAYLLCAESVEWIELRRKGLNDFYFARDLDDAANFFVKGGAEKNRGRRRALIREYWEKNDPLRFRGIDEVFGRRT